MEEDDIEDTEVGEFRSHTHTHTHAPRKKRRKEELERNIHVHGFRKRQQNERGMQIAIKQVRGHTKN